MSDRRPGSAATSTRRQGAYDQLLAAIIFGDLAPGSSVDEKNLAREFNLGLSAVRDALFRLSIEGLIDRQPRVGTRIPELTLRELQDVFEARVLIEGSSAALAAQRASPEDIARMRSAFAGYEHAIRGRDFRRLVKMDVAFHRGLGAASHNKQIERQVVLLHKNASRFWFFGLPRLDPKMIRADIAGHLEVIHAIEHGNAARAEQAMRAVLGHFPDAVRVFLTGAMAIKEERSGVRSEVDRRERKRPQKSARSATSLP